MVIEKILMDGFDFDCINVDGIKYIEASKFIGSYRNYYHKLLENVSEENIIYNPKKKGEYIKRFVNESILKAMKEKYLNNIKMKDILNPYLNQ